MNLQEMFWANAAIQAIGFVAVIIIVIAMDTEIAELYELALNQARTIRAKQAEIDRLMLEYCPDEMTPEQIAEWGANQKPITEEWHGQSNINSRFNACQHKEYCCQLQNRVNTTGETK